MMGGNALKIKTRRYNKEEFQRVTKEILPVINKFTSKRVKIIECYSEKETFGDMDILIEEDGEYKEILEKIKGYFNPDEIKSSGKRVWSFNYKDFQIDILFVNSSLFKMSDVYFKYNDMGMLIGRMAHSIGLKYGFQGLRYFIYTPNKDALLSKVLLTKDPKKIFEVMDLNYKRYEKGFKNYEEIFEYLSTSKYFNYDVFNDALIRSKDRRRDKKRSSYYIFKEWLEKNKKRFNRKRLVLNKEEKINFIDKEFPEINIRKKIDEEYKKFYESKEARNLFNGRLVMKRYPSLKGKKLGNAIGEFKEFLGGSKKWKIFVLQNEQNPERIWMAFEEFLSYFLSRKTLPLGSGSSTSNKG